MRLREALVMVRVAALAVVLMVVAPSLRADVTWEPIGPVGGFVDFVVSSPADSETVYVGSRAGGGVYVSHDAGTTWRAANNGLTDTRMTVLAADPTDASTVYAGTLSGGFKTTDGGASWLPIAGGFPATEVDAIAIDPERPSFVYVCGVSGALAVSGNAGATWSNIGNEDTAKAQPQRLAVDPQSGTVFLATASGGVFWTSDAGQSWDSSTSGLEGTFGDRSSVLAIAVDPSNPHRLYAGTATDGVFVSTNSGGDWTNSSDGMPLFEDPFTTVRFYYAVSDILIQPDGTAYAAAQYRVFVRNPGASSWTGGVDFGALDHSVINLGTINQLAFGSGSPPALYLALGRNVPGSGGPLAYGAFERFDAMGPSDHVFSFASVWSVATDPSAPGAVVLTANGSFEWTPGEGSDGWNGPITYFPNFEFLVLPLSAYFDVRTTGVVYAGSGGRVYKSVDGGLTYPTGALVGNPTVLPQPIVETFVAEPGSSSGLFAGTTLGLFVSEDAGGSWSPGSADLASRNVLALAADASAGSTLWAGTDDGVYESADSGAHWSRSGALVGTVAAVLAVGGSEVLAGGDAGLFASRDGGATWTAVPGVAAPVHALAQDSRSGLVAAGTAAGVYESVDGGATWAASNEGLDNPDVTCLAVLDGGALLAGTAGGVFQRVEIVPRVPVAPPEASRIVHALLPRL